MKAIWQGRLIAQSNNTIIIENNHYFPPESVCFDLLTKSETTSICPWKGMASYYTISINGDKNKDAAWYYQTPKKAALEIKNYVAFWKGVEVAK